jgi:PEP-CTERM motif
LRIRRIVLAGLGLVCLAAPARADLIYTWNEDDGQAVTGSLDVNSVALTNGVIQNADVIAFSWSDPFASYGTSDLAPFTEGIPISTINGSFTDNTSFPRSVDGNLVIPATAGSMSPGGGFWGDGDIGGTGHWTVAISSVPEPSTLLLSVIAGVVGLGAWARRRRSA